MRTDICSSKLFASSASLFESCLDVSPLLEKWDDPSMAQDKGVADVVRQLGQACKEAGFFYVVIYYA